MVVKGRDLKVRFAVSSSLVKVENIHPLVSNELLRDAFAQFGEVEEAVVVTDDRGKSKGCGIVEFARKQSAMNAISQCRNAPFLLTRCVWVYVCSSSQGACGCMCVPPHKVCGCGCMCVPPHCMCVPPHKVCGCMCVPPHKVCGCGCVPPHKVRVGVCVFLLTRCVWVYVCSSSQGVCGCMCVFPHKVCVVVFLYLPLICIQNKNNAFIIIQRWPLLRYTQIDLQLGHSGLLCSWPSLCSYRCNCQDYHSSGVNIYSLCGVLGLLTRPPHTHTGSSVWCTGPAH